MNNTVNYGYACINLSLDCKYTNIKKPTLDSKGLPHLAKIIESNLETLTNNIEWNKNRGIKLYRMPSGMFSLMSFLTEDGEPLYFLEDLPNYQWIKNKLKSIGEDSLKNDIRLTFHPTHFNCLASPSDIVVRNTVRDLDCHGQILDLMGLPRTRWNKINIHVGGSYGDKEGTLKRFKENLNLLDSCSLDRLTVENDDRKNLYTVQDLTSIGIPIVFDSLHWDCHNDGYSYEETFNLAYNTWGEIIPVFHHSSSKQLEVKSATKKSHADYLYEKMETFDKDLYVVLESKKKDLALLDYLKKYYNYD